MIKNLVKHGNSLALILDKPILDMLRIDPDTPLELTSNGDALMVSPVRKPSRQKRLKAAVDRINSKFADDLKRLAE